MSERGRIASPLLERLARGGRPPRSPEAPSNPPGAPAQAGAAAASVASGWASGDAALECDLCALPIGDPHRHLVDLHERALRCVCRACSILFDRTAAGGNHYRLVPERVCRLQGFDLPDPLWAALRIPVDMAFFLRSGAEERVLGFYPSPFGATESLLELESWSELLQRNPVLQEMEDDVEALLVNRARGAREYWLVPVDVCYTLVGVIRTHWRGMAGGTEVWDRLVSFFEDLSGRASPRAADDRARGDARPGRRRSAAASGEAPDATA